MSSSSSRRKRDLALRKSLAKNAKRNPLTLGIPVYSPDPEKDKLRREVELLKKQLEFTEAPNAANLRTIHEQEEKIKSLQAQLNKTPLPLSFWQRLLYLFRG